MKAEHAEEYTQSLGQIVAGGWRQIALGERLGVPKALGLTTREWVEQRLGGYVRLSVAERHGAVAELKAEGLPNTKIAQVLGVDEITVRRDSTNDEPKALEPVDSSQIANNDSTNVEPVDAIAALAIGEARDKEAKRTERTPRLPSPKPLPAGEFAVIYADPPWRYEHPSTPSRAIENHYPTMDLDEIKALQVPAAADAILFLWTPSPKLTESIEVAEAWGFMYRTCLVWVKDKIGMGYYCRQKHELLLVCKCGDMPAPDETELPPSVIEAPRGRHSEKPEEFYSIIERLYPRFAYLELFARQEREGWTSWINEAVAA